MPDDADYGSEDLEVAHQLFLSYDVDTKVWLWVITMMYYGYDVNFIWITTVKSSYWCKWEGIIKNQLDLLMKLPQYLWISPEEAILL